MKNVGDKPDSLRRARATASLYMPEHCLALIRSGQTEKGDPLATARVAGILAAKRTDEILPLCHPLPLQHADVHFQVMADHVRVETEVQTIGPTGVEMEALTAASVAALTLYDMLKPYTDQTQLRLSDCHLLGKTGGKSHYRRELAFAVDACVIVLSDTVAAGRGEDTAGRAVVEQLQKAGFDPIDYRVLPDEPEQLTAAVREQLERGTGLIVTVGGTGIGPRDRTVETVRPFITAELPGLMETARAFGQRRMPYAMMSRGIGGMAGNTLILTFPGSRKGALESLAALLPGLIHIFEVCRDQPHPGGYGREPAAG